MKKFFFFLFALVSVMILPAFGQMTNYDILELIQVNKEYNQHNSGVQNPNLIYPGQTLTYFFQDGASADITVNPGDNQWVIVRDKLSKLREEHGEIINPVQPDPQPQVEPDPELESVFTSPTMPWWVWLLMVIMSLIFIFIMRMATSNQDPVTAGEPQVPGGVRDAGAYNRIREVAQNRFPGARLDIRNIRRGRLSGLATVHYASGKPKRLRLKKVQAYAGEVVVNGNIETIYFLQGCGNDARQGNFMSGDLLFEPDVIVNEDGSESPLPVMSTEPIAQPEPVHVETVRSERSEYDGQVGQAMKLAEKVVTENPSHEVSIEIPKGEGSFKMVIKAQYPQKEKKS